MNTTTRIRPPASRRKLSATSARQALDRTAVANPDGQDSDAPQTAATADFTPRTTPIYRCIHAEMERYFETLDGQVPHDLYRLVMQQAEQALLGFVMEQTRHNQSKAAAWLGISRGTLRGKLADMPKPDNRPT